MLLACGKILPSCDSEKKTKREVLSHCNNQDLNHVRIKSNVSIFSVTGITVFLLGCDSAVLPITGLLAITVCILSFHFIYIFL